MELFEPLMSGQQPLATRLRPRTLAEYVGQKHCLAENAPLRQAIKLDALSSLILQGPPGTGKTSLVHIIAQETNKHFVALNAVFSGIKDLREVIDAAKRRLEQQQQTILFIDEIHRWNKSQQDALLPWIESGTIIFIGATTENPYFELNHALLSRSQIYVLTLLSEDDLRVILERALTDAERGYGAYRCKLDDKVTDSLVQASKGDARILLNDLEALFHLASQQNSDTLPVDGDEIELTYALWQQMNKRVVNGYDKKGDEHYSSISAFIKSIRGSDADAALYWLAKMLEGGEDVKFIIRRMIISASEDVGMACPQALIHTQTAAQAFERVGLPEGRFILAQMALYLSTAPKSNTTLAINTAFEWVKEGRNQVPEHLRNPTPSDSGEHFSANYLYPHDYKDHWVVQSYLPQEFAGRSLYQPTSQGYEATIQKEVIYRRQLIDKSVSEQEQQLSQHEIDLELEQRLSFVKQICASSQPDPQHPVINLLSPSSVAYLWEFYTVLGTADIQAFFSQKQALLEAKDKVKILEVHSRPQLLELKAFAQQHKQGINIIGDLEQNHAWLQTHYQWLTTAGAKHTSDSASTAALCAWSPNWQDSSRPSLYMSADFLDTELGQHYLKLESLFYEELQQKQAKIQNFYILKDKTTLYLQYPRKLSSYLISKWFDSEAKEHPQQERFSSYLKHHLKQEELHVLSAYVATLLGKKVVWQRHYHYYVL